MYKTFSDGLLGSNTHLVWDEESREGMVVDLGNTPKKIFDFAAANSIEVKYLVLTHGHFDHAEYAEEYCKIFPEAKLMAHKNEAAVLCDPVANVSIYMGEARVYPLPDVSLCEGDSVMLGKTAYRVLNTPGHTPGSICLYSKQENLMLTGDTLFDGGRGRCDFRYGSEEDMRASLERLLKMDGKILFLSGHGAPSVIADQRGVVF